MIALVFLALVAAAVLYGDHEIHAPQGSSAAAIAFRVRLGDTDSSVAGRLGKRGLLHDTLLFQIDSKLRGLGSKLRIGTFMLRPNMSIDQMVSALASQPPKQVHITIPPGLRETQIAEILDTAGISGRQFLHTVRHPDFRIGCRTQVPRNHTLEGFLFPDTYFVEPGISGRAFARIMICQFDKVFEHQLRAVARREHRWIYHVVTLASIIQREDGFPSQGRTVASVFYNRLRLGMPLQSDATVSYAMGSNKDWWPPPTITADHTLESPYNTYLHPGLPPGPICNPDLMELRAALRPRHTAYLYFFGDKHGHLHFATTLQQQIANGQRYG